MAVDMVAPDLEIPGRIAIAWDNPITRDEKKETSLVDSFGLSAIKSKLNVIFCIGESSFQRKNKKTNIILKNQIMSGLKGIGKKCKIIVAYEPVWSIGTGVVPNNLELEKNIKFIKSIISKRFKNYKILYGGSVSPNNIKKLNMIDLLDGYLIGGASQTPNKFIDIIKKTIN